MNSKEDRWRCFSIEEIRQRDYKIDSLKWLKDESVDEGDEATRTRRIQPLMLGGTQISGRGTE